MKKKRGLVSCIQEFKKDTILTPIFVIGEVAFDVLIPMMTGRLLTQGVEAGNMERIFYYGGIVVLMALAALLLGALSGRYAARRPPASPAICAGRCIRMFRNFPFPTSTNSPPAVSLPV